ncbi:SubName: Full=Uncharacterized protein {ECO:0000313/EMBL:CCA71429.1} [Serendipita indica DSM 11827]|nr:SubName: Full=Uncharacterized protein {ECO:0000313/EMBL:CCA71429.1} [Serendipita indica DSM 11827]
MSPVDEWQRASVGPGGLELPTPSSLFSRPNPARANHPVVELDTRLGALPASSYPSNILTNTSAQSISKTS